MFGPSACSQNRLRSFGADGLSNLGRLDGRTLDLRKTYMCSICLPQSGQAPASHVSQPHKAQSFSGLFPACLAFGPCKQIPSFTMSISKTPALCKAAKLVIRGLNGHMPDHATTVMEWWSQTGSNRRPEACKATALPTELWPRLTHPSRSRIHRTQPQSWWAWEDLNFRPHAYQARALTN